MKYTKPLLVPLLSCSLGLSITLGLSTNALCEEEVKSGKKNSERTQFLPKVDVHFEYSVDGRSFLELFGGEKLRSEQYYRIRFTPYQDCYIRVSQKDSTGNKQLLHKNADRIFVKANTTQTLPAQNEAYYLDNVTGQETIYFEAYYPHESKSGSGGESKGSGGTKPIVPLQVIALRRRIV